jgi:hypothetical protein
MKRVKLVSKQVYAYKDKLTETDDYLIAHGFVERSRY